MAEKLLNIPEGVKVSIEGNKLFVEGPKGKIEKRLSIPKDVNVEVKENKVRVYSSSEKRKIKAIVGTVAAHIRNAIKGVREGWKYKLHIVYSHFPVTVNVSGDKVLIQNFLGEKKPREAKIVGNVKVEVKGKEIIVSGVDIDEVSQTAANIEHATRIVGYDRRVFQDGIYIVEKKAKMD